MLKILIKKTWEFAYLAVLAILICVLIVFAVKLNRKANARAEADRRYEIWQKGDRKVRPDMIARANRIIGMRRPSNDFELDFVILNFHCETEHAKQTIKQNRKLLKQLRDIRDEMVTPPLLEVPKKSRGKTR